MNEPTEFELVLGWLDRKWASVAWCGRYDGGTWLYFFVGDDDFDAFRIFEVLVEARLLHPLDPAVGRPP